MVDRPRVGIASPALAASNNGNWHTAARWGGHLEPIADVTVFDRWTGQPLDLLIALHARKSADCIESLRNARPDAGIILLLTGTDLYRDLPGDPAAQRSLDLADRIVVLQARALDKLAPDARRKAEVIEQSAEGAVGHAQPAPPTRFLAVGHLRAEKDPLTLTRAACRLAAEDAVAIEHIGNALDRDIEADVRLAMARCPHYRWCGGVPHEETLQRIAGSHALVHPSRMEGGANVVIEAVRAGVPVLASAIDGNVGLLGEDYQGYFPVGDDAALAALMRRFTEDQSLRQALQAQCRAIEHRFAPEVERRAVQELVRSVSGSPMRRSRAG